MFTDVAVIQYVLIPSVKLVWRSFLPIWESYTLRHSAPCMTESYYTHLNKNLKWR